MPPANEDDPYAFVAKGPLKLKKNQSESKKKKKKLKEKEKMKTVEVVQEVDKEVKDEESKSHTIYKTKAELKFLEMKEKNKIERIKQKASKTHKQRVEEFNRHLDSLTEHFDIPKVSWTK